MTENSLAFFAIHADDLADVAPGFSFIRPSNLRGLLESEAPLWGADQFGATDDALSTEAETRASDLSAYVRIKILEELENESSECSRLLANVDGTVRLLRSIVSLVAGSRTARNDGLRALLFGLPQSLANADTVSRASRYAHTPLLRRDVVDFLVNDVRTANAESALDTLDPAKWPTTVLLEDLSSFRDEAAAALLLSLRDELAVDAGRHVTLPLVADGLTVLSRIRLLHETGFSDEE